MAVQRFQTESTYKERTAGYEQFSFGLLNEHFKSMDGNISCDES